MVNDPTTKAQAEALTRKYYEKEHAQAKAKGEKSNLPEEPKILSWDLKDDGSMVVVDGASGRKLTFAPEKSKPAPAPARASRKTN